MPRPASNRPACSPRSRKAGCRPAAQLVAEELECDWSKVVTEYPTPGQSVARKRAWDCSTGGSRGIRTSQEYVRKGGATSA